MPPPRRVLLISQAGLKDRNSSIAGAVGSQKLKFRRESVFKMEISDYLSWDKVSFIMFDAGDMQAIVTAKAFLHFVSCSRRPGCASPTK
jgi:hypothetical protein